MTKIAWTKNALMQTFNVKILVWLKNKTKQKKTIKNT